MLEDGRTVPLTCIHLALAVVSSLATTEKAFTDIYRSLETSTHNSLEGITLCTTHST